MHIKIEKMSDEFTKYHLGEISAPAVLHRFTAPDAGSPHDHPFRFASHVLWGGYVERVYIIDEGGEWTTETIYRPPGSVFSVRATHIHQIIELPNGECGTIIIPGVKVREWRFWKFNGKQTESRAWYEGDFEK